MANISSELAAIMAAVYGRDVRQSIHDAIDKINKVSEKVLDAGTEIDSGDPVTKTYGIPPKVGYDGSFYFNTTSNNLLECDGSNWVIRDNLEGNAITSITKTGTSGLVDTYTINFSKAPSITFDVTNGRGIVSVALASSLGLTDTYEITYNDGTSDTFDVTNGRGVVSITKTSSAGLVDTYAISYNDGTTDAFTVTNGKDGVNGKDGSVWYKGTALNGTGANLTGFPGNLNDFYLNSTTGMVYNCTKTGAAMAPGAAEWEYVMTLVGGGGGGGTVTIVNNLTSTAVDEALSANMGRVLNEKIKPISPTPAASLDLSDVRTTMAAAALQGSENEQLLSAWAVGEWSNTKTRRIIYNGTLNIGDDTIGTWPNDAELIALNGMTVAQRQAAEGSSGYKWWHDDLLIGLDSFDDYDISFKYDPAIGDDLIMAGYILDTDTGNICIKFGDVIASPNNKVAIDITVINNGLSYGPN